MIKIQKSSTLIGAQRFGQCLSCGAGSREAEIYQIQFSLPGSTKDSSLRLCKECIKDLEKKIKSIC